MVSAFDLLASVPPTESGGPLAKNRLAYQSDWTFCLLLSLHLRGDDYVVICDYHDDVVVIDKSNITPILDFYQLKTDSKGTWNLRRLVSRKYRWFPRNNPHFQNYIHST